MNYILTYWDRDVKWNAVQALLRSVRKHVNQCTVLLFTEEPQSEKSNQVLSKFLFTRAIHSPDVPDLSYINKRWIHFRNFILGNDFSEDDRFLIIDSRDAVFQGNIFETEATPGVHLFCESNMTISQIPTMYDWMIRTNPIFATFVRNEVYPCAGVVLVNGFKHLVALTSYIASKAISQTLEFSKIQPIDQAILTEYYLMSRSHFSMTLHSHGQWVCNLMHSEPGERMVDGGLSLQNSEDPIYVVHQYDRLNPADQRNLLTNAGVPMDEINKLFELPNESELAPEESLNEPEPEHVDNTLIDAEVISNEIGSE